MKSFFMRCALVCFCLFFGGMAQAQSDAEREYAVAPPPAWIEDISYDASQDVPAYKVSGGLHFILVDSQDRITEQTHEIFYRSVQKVINHQGVKDAAHVTINFNPAHEKLTIHKLAVYRDGEEINQLDQAEISVLQRESELEYQIYDGSKVVNIFLKDIRKGDVIEYSYTYDGFNPVFKGKYYSFQPIQWAVPVQHLVKRILMPKDRPLYINNVKTDLEPTTTEVGEFTEYRYELNDIPAIVPDSYIPYWYIVYPEIQFSENQHWHEVVEWALDLYQLPDELSEDLQKKVNAIAAKTQDPKERLRAAFDFVQNDVRYLGIQVGQGAYKPNDPNLVFERRFGDCKDKSLLFVTMLKALGIEAYAALVHADLAHSIDLFAPSPIIFSHVITQVILDDNAYWLDPTLSNQFGPLEEMYLPEYKRALLIKPGIEGLVDVPVNKFTKPHISIHERFDLREGVNKQAALDVITTFRSWRADSQRTTFESQSLEEIAKIAINYYGSEYPAIAHKEDIVVTDNKETNEIVLKESYLIDEIWKTDEKKERFEIQFYPLSIYNYITSPENSVRSMPLALFYPLIIDYQIKVLLPEAWDIEPHEVAIRDKGFSLDVNTAYQNQVLTLTYRYEALADHVPAEFIKEHVNNINMARTNLAYEIYYSPGKASYGLTHMLKSIFQ